MNETTFGCAVHLVSLVFTPGTSSDMAVFIAIEAKIAFAYASR